MDQGHDLVPVLDPARRVRGLEAAVALVRTLDLANINPPVTRRIRGTGPGLTAVPVPNLARGRHVVPSRHDDPSPALPRDPSLVLGPETQKIKENRRKVWFKSL